MELLDTVLKSLSRERQASDFDCEKIYQCIRYNFDIYKWPYYLGKIIKNPAVWDSKCGNMPYELETV